MAGVQYSIKKNRLKHSCIKGFDMTEEGSLSFNQKELMHSIFITALDGVASESTWGRLSFDITHDEEMLYYVYVLAADEDTFYDDDGRQICISKILLDPDTDSAKKVAFMQNMGAIRFISQNDVLLYTLKGRFLYLGFEIFGAGDMVISNIRVNAVGDDFMDTFPEIYRERNSFFHRYMSIYSSIYNDMQDTIDDIHEVLDLDKCSTELLELYSSWMGIDLHGGFLSEDVLRKLVKELYSLNRMKGTRAAIKRLLEIVLDCDFIIVEHSYLLEGKLNEDIAVQEGLDKGSVYDVTILVDGKITEELMHQVSFLLDQFKPARTAIKLIQMDKTATLDSNSFLDMNACIPTEKPVILDKEISLDGIIALK